MSRVVRSPYDDNKPWLTQAREDAATGQLAEMRAPPLTLTNTQVKKLTNTPIEVIPALGANKIAIPTLTVITTSGFSAHQYTGANADGYLTLQTTVDIQDIAPNDSGIPLTYLNSFLTVEGLTVVSSPLSQGFYQGWGIVAGTIGGPIALFANKAIYIAINNNGNVTDLGGGHVDNTMKVRVNYAIIDV